MRLLLRRFLRRPGGGATAQDPAPEDWARLAEEARREWETSQAYFRGVSDPDLIDYAIYRLKAAERRYVYLLKQARGQGVRVTPVRGRTGGAEGRG